MDTLTFVDYEALRALAKQDNEDSEGLELPESFATFDVDFTALGQFAMVGVLQYMEQVGTDTIDPEQALLGMWFGGVKMGMLIRDEQRRRIVEEFGSLQIPDAPPEEES